MSEVTVDQSELLAAVLDSNVAAIFVLDTMGRIVFANRQAEQVLGLTVSDIVGKSYNAPEWVSTDVHGGPWPDEKQAFARVMSTGQPCFDVRMGIEWPDGRRRLLSINGAPIKDGDGTITAATFSAIDISDRIRIETELRDKAEQLNLAMEAARLGTWSWTVAADEVMWSDEVLQIFGFSRADFGGTFEAYMDTVHPDDAEWVRETVDSALTANSDDYFIEHRVIRSDGQVRWIEGRGRVERDSDGQPVRMIGTVIDITQRKDSEMALRGSEEMLRSVIDTVPSYIVSVAPDHSILYLNRTLPHLRVEDVIGQDVVQFLAEDSRDGYRHALNRTFTTGETHEIEANVLQPDGGTAPFLIRLGPVMSGGIVRSVTSVGIDLTRRKQAERALQDSREQLRRAQRLESVGRLAGGVAHDFNNLLTAIVGCADLANAALSDRPKEQQLLMQIQEAAKRGANLTKQLLAFAREQVVQPRVVDLNVLINDIGEMLPRLIGEHIALETRLEDDLWPVEIDPGQFEQVIVNLAVNARDAMPDGGRLTISSANVQDVDRLDFDTGAGQTADWVAITIRDTGSGMDEGTLQHVFEPFFTTKDTGKGTGLGLATCFGIVRKAGGHIKAESQVGEWTQFELFFPRTHDELDARPETEPAAPLQEGRGRILLVEDDDTVRNVTRAMLESAGYELVDASDGISAQSAFDKHNGDVDLLITDVIMPSMNGAELADRLLSVKPDLEVLFLSGYSPDVGPLRALIERGVELMQKPFTARQLSERVRRILRDA